MTREEKKFFTPFLNGYSKYENIVVYFNDFGDYITSLELSYSFKNRFKFHYNEIINLLGENYVLQKNDVLLGNNKYKSYLTITHRTNRGFYKYNKKNFSSFGSKIKELFSYLKANKLSPLYIDYERIKFIRLCFLSNVFSNKIMQKSFNVFNSHLEINNSYTKVVTIGEINKKQIDSQSFESLLIEDITKTEEFSNIDSFIYNQSINIPNQNKKKSFYKSQLKKNSESKNQSAILKKERLNHLCSLIDNDIKIIDCFFSFTIKGSEEKVTILLNKIQSLFNDYGIKINLQSFNQLEIFSKTFPGTTIDVPSENIIELDSKNLKALIFN